MRKTFIEGLSLRYLTFARHCLSHAISRLSSARDRDSKPVLLYHCTAPVLPYHCTVLHQFSCTTTALHCTAPLHHYHLPVHFSSLPATTGATLLPAAVTWDRIQNTPGTQLHSYSMAGCQKYHLLATMTIKLSTYKVNTYSTVLTQGRKKGCFLFGFLDNNCHTSHSEMYQEGLIYCVLCPILVSNHFHEIAPSVLACVSTLSSCASVGCIKVASSPGRL